MWYQHFHWGNFENSCFLPTSSISSVQKFLEFAHISDEWYDTGNRANSEIVALVNQQTYPVKQLHVVRGTQTHIFAS